MRKNKIMSVEKCPNCGANYSRQIENKFSATELEKLEGVLKILKSRKDPYQKKIALFDWLKKLEVGTIEPSEEQRVNCLLQGKLYNELAKQKMREYKELTGKRF